MPLFPGSVRNELNYRTLSWCRRIAWCGEKTLHIGIDVRMLVGTRIGNRKFPTVLDAGSFRSRSIWQSWFLVRSLFLAYRQPPSHYVLMWSFLGACTWRVCPLVSLPIRPLVLLDEGSTITNSFNLNYFVRGLVSKPDESGAEWLLLNILRRNFENLDSDKGRDVSSGRRK